MAYAALASLSNTLSQILYPHHHHRFIPFKKPQIESLYKCVRSLQHFLWYTDSEDSKGALSTDDFLEAKIRNAAYKAEDIIESHIRNHFLPQTDDHGYKSFKICCRDLEYIIKEIVSLKIKAGIKLKRLKNKAVIKVMKRLQIRSPWRYVGSGDNLVVGVDDEASRIIDQLTSNQSELQIIPIVGMGGLGKTTLAKYVYNKLIDYFETSAWITVSQNFQVHAILLGLLNQTMILTPEMHQATDQKLQEYLCKSLSGRRYLIVMDDVWSREPWDVVKKCLPDDNTGSRILLTTRKVDVADYVNPGGLHLQKRLLSDEESFQLLAEKAFEGESCPEELLGICRKLSIKCHGLPLAVAVLGRLLSKKQASVSFWFDINQQISETLNEDWHDILRLGYIYLPYHLKACFLYMGLFPEDYVIRASKLIKLWDAEGFLNSKTLEQIAEEYLEELIDRNLISVHERGSNGKAKACGIHDILRDLCLRIGQEENSFHGSGRRHLLVNLDSWKHEDVDDCDGNDVLNPFGIAPKDETNVRSLQFVGHPIEGWGISTTCFRLKLLRVFNAVNFQFIGFPEEVLQLVNLRYLAFTCDSNIPSSISLLWNLQTLINNGSSDLPYGIWEMPWLRHVHFNKGLLPTPVNGKKSRVLHKLETLSEVTNFRFTEEVFRRLPNVRKLKIYYGNPSSAELYNLPRFHQMETLKITCCSKLKHRILQILAFPMNLKKLTLSGCRIPWQYMTVVGSLPNLEVLKLKDHAFSGSIWETVEGEFYRLKILLLSELDLVEWRTDDFHFPILQHLVIDRCLKLREIPAAFTYLPTLEKFKLINCNPSASASAKQIREETRCFGAEIQFQSRQLYTETAKR